MCAHRLFSFVHLVLITAVGGTLFLGYRMRREQHELHQAVAKIQTECIKQPYNASAEEPCHEKHLITKSELWRPIQEHAKDTVVQVFAQIIDVDILQPYRTPAQRIACGSGFFINDEGELITNAHVVGQAYAAWIQMPCLGKQIIDVEVVGISEHDIALLRVNAKDLELIKQACYGTVPYLPLGNSNLVRRADEILALGYPLGQKSLKSTTGVISGREQGMIQMSAAINPGSSGGPSLNIHGEVIGINTAAVTEAQNVGYAIPINDLKRILPELRTTKLLRIPFLGIVYNNSTEALTEYLGNPAPGGCYLVEVIKGSTLYKAGVERGDMMYEINGNRIDMYGEMNVPWSEDKISLSDYIATLAAGQEIQLVLYRRGQRKDVSVTFNKSELPPVRKMYPGYEKIEYEVVAGMVVMPLTLNHVQALASSAPGLFKYAEIRNQREPALLITHIFPNCQLYRSRTITVGATLEEVNGIPVRTLNDLRNAIRSAVGTKFLSIKAADNSLHATEHIFVVLSLDKLLQEEPIMARDFRYPLSGAMQELIQAQIVSNSEMVRT